MNTKVIIQAKSSINLSLIPDVYNKRVVLSKGKYEVTFISDIHFSGQTMPLNQVMIFSTTPITSKESEKWYFTPVKTQGTFIDSDGINPIYVFTVDQITSNDNTGSATVSFTMVN